MSNIDPLLAMATRPAAFAGTWYPAKPQALLKLLEEAWSLALEIQSDSMLPDPRSFGPFGLLLPHAGLLYSAVGIAAGFSRAEAAFGAHPQRVLIFAPSHYTPLRDDALFTTSASILETPLGNLRHVAPQNLPVSARIIAQEHAIEMFLPLIAWRWPDAEVTLVVCGPASSSDAARQSMSHLSQWDQAGTLVIASSDMTHSGPRFGDEKVRSGASGKAAENTILARDRAALDLLCNDGDQLFYRQKELAPTMCGLGPALLVANWFVSGSQHILCQYSSARSGPPIGPASLIGSLGPADSVVSYAALDFGEPRGENP